MAGRPWETKEIVFLKEMVQKRVTCKEIAKQLGRTTRAVQHKFNELNLIKPSLCIGDKINRLTILDIYHKYKYNQNISYAKCKCDCGKIICSKLTSIVQNTTKSCGCLKSEKSRQRMKKINYKHGMGNFSVRLYRIWAAMRCRCNNPNSIGYHNYGGRGISVCEEWNDFKNFYIWAINNGYSDDLSIDRINVNGNYNPNNCRWATMAQQCANRRNSIRANNVLITAFGETKSIIDWLNDNRCCLKSISVISYRIGAGWEPEEAISKPSERQFTKNKQGKN